MERTLIVVGEKGHRKLALVLVDSNGKVLQADGSWVLPESGLGTPKIIRRIQRTIQFLLHDPAYSGVQKAVVAEKKKGSWELTNVAFPKR